MSDNLQQFKMTNGDEIICELVQWPENEDQDVIIRKVLKINSSESYVSGAKYYSLRPWMSFFDNMNLLYMLNPLHVVCQIEPSADLKTLYLETLQMLAEDIADGKHKMIKSDRHRFSDSAAEEIFKNNSELFDSLIDEQYNLDFRSSQDSAEQRLSNIVKFRKPKGTIH
jgi:hypothetical protein